MTKKSVGSRLTKRQLEIFCAVAEKTRRHGFPPTVREIGSAVGLNSPSSVKYQLDAIARAGYIARGSRQPRTLELTEEGNELLRSLHGESPAPQNPSPSSAPVAAVPVSRQDEQNSVDVPLVGKIAAGTPITAEQITENVFPLPRKLTGHGQLFMLRVKGDSMIDAAICDGDVLVVRYQQTAENGEIVAAMIDGEATVKVFSRRDGHILLLPRNPHYDPIPADNCTILGRVVLVMRSI